MVRLMSSDHHHHHGPPAEVSDSRLLWSVVLNVGLTVVEVVVGIFAGSLSLIADAVHNFSDAGALFIAFVARRVARRKPDERFTFGYRRAELIGAMMNLTTLILVGLYLIYEAAWRLADPQAIQTGWVMVAAAIALLVDVLTALFLWTLSKGSLNVRAAFVHNLIDAAASVAVLLGALAIDLFGALWIDPLLTFGIAAYVLILSVQMLRRTSSILMQGAPPDFDAAAVVEAMVLEREVLGVHHLHAWELDESHRAFEAHVVIGSDMTLSEACTVRERLMQILHCDFGIDHTTLEFELEDTDCKPAHVEPICND
jgi:cobalt-zinc-cadmium efflux system protein